MNGKQLKNSILQWAIQGRLVPQDPNDEPASVLLERIRTEKARLVKEGKIKKDKNESIIFRGDDNSHYEKFLATGEVKCIDDEIPFEIPQGWEWCRLGNIFSHCTGKALNGTNRKGKLYSYITTSNLYWDRFELSSLKEMYFTEDELEKCTATKGDLLVCEGGDIGRSAIWNYEYDIRIQNHIHKLRAYLPVCTRFFYYIMYLYKGIGYIGGKGIGIQGLSSGALHNILIPTPPINEQERIVSKIEAIMPIATKYEKSQEELNLLNDNIHNRLKKSILQEAIQGKLVLQIAEEGTAQELLEQIRQEKQRLVKEGKLKKSALSDSVIFKGDDNKYYEKIGNETVCIDVEIPLDIPQSWSWMRLGFLVSNETGLSYSKDCLSEKSSRMIRVLRGGNIEEGRWLTKDDDVMISASYVKDELILKRGTFITPAVTSIERMAKTALVEVDQSDIVVGGFVLMLKPFIKDDSLLRYLNLLFQSVYYKQYCTGITNKSGQAFYNLSRQKLMKCLVPIAPTKEMSRIAEKFASLSL